MMEDINKQIAKRLKIWGKQHFGTMKKMAEILDVSYGVLRSSYLNGRNLPGAKILMDLAKHGCDINWLLNDKPDYPLIVNEPKAEYNSKAYQIEKLKQEIAQLKAENKKLKQELNKIVSTATKILDTE